MKSKITIILLFILFCCGGKALAQCDCGYGNPDIAAYLTHRDFKLADAVFVGKVTEIKQVLNKADNDYDVVVTFEVKKAWKRDLKQSVILRNFTGCDLGYKLNDEWLVYAYDRGDSAFRIDCCCSGTKRLSLAEVDLKTFEEKGEKPTKIKKESKNNGKPNNSMDVRAKQRLCYRVVCFLFACS